MLSPLYLHEFRNICCQVLLVRCIELAFYMSVILLLGI
jgi:hypothetical protein